MNKPKISPKKIQIVSIVVYVVLAIIFHIRYTKNYFNCAADQCYGIFFDLQATTTQLVIGGSLIWSAGTIVIFKRNWILRLLGIALLAISLFMLGLLALRRDGVGL